MRDVGLTEELIEADVLCVGGGIAGLMAAARAAELGARVVVAEKGNALFSGRGRAGNDHSGATYRRCTVRTRTSS